MRAAFHLWLATMALAWSSHGGIVTNGGFEDGLAGWRPLWTRDAGAGTLTLDPQVVHAGKAAARIEHRGAKDWSLEPTVRVPVTPGDVFELEAWVKLESQGGSATLCVSTWDHQGQAVDWSYGARSVEATTDWQRLRSRFVTPEGVAQIQPRLIGYGPATVWVDDFALEKKLSAATLRRTPLPAVLSVSNATLIVSLNTSNTTLAVVDRRTGQRVEQQPRSRAIFLTDAAVTRGEIRLSLLDAASGMAIAGHVRLDANLPEFTLELTAQGELPTPLRFPHPFVSRNGDYLVVPMNEGISYPVDDPSIEPMRLVAYGGHGICMAFWGATDGTRGHMAIIETPDDAAIRIDRETGKLAIAPEWDPQRAQFGYARRLR